METIEKYDITNSIFLLMFDQQHSAALTFVRFQEHYESPKFRGTTLTLDEYKEWYINNSLGEEEFTCFEDWHGFNIPSKTLNPFYSGDFDPLREKEEQLLDMFSDTETPFYIIDTHRGIEDRIDDNIKHETGHGLFYTDSSYRREVREVISQFNLSDMKEELGDMSGYHENVIEDECHAYSLAENRLDADRPPELHEELNTLFKQYLDKHNAAFPAFVTVPGIDGY